MRVAGILTFSAADKREFIKISQAVGMGFLVMVSTISATPGSSAQDHKLTP